MKKAKRENNFGARYDDAFKAAAVKLFRSSDKSLREVASILGIAGRTLKIWLRQAEIDQGPLCQRRVRQPLLDISVPKGGEWISERAQANSSSWS